LGAAGHGLSRLPGPVRRSCRATRGSRPATRGVDPMTRRATQWLVALAACVAMIALNALTGEFPHEAVRVVDVGRPGRLYDSTVTVNSWRIGQVLYNDDLFVGRSAVIFLAVNVTVATDGTERSTSWEVGGT